MKRFVFGYGGCSEGYKTHTFTISDGKVKSNPWNHARLTAKNFIMGIAEFHIGEWERKYINNNVPDGTQWSIDIEYDDERKPVHIEGSNAFPYNFRELMRFLEVKDE